MKIQLLLHCKDKLCTQRFTATSQIPTTSSNFRDNVIIIESNNHRIPFRTHKRAIVFLYCHAGNLSIAPQINPLVKCVRSVARPSIESLLELKRQLPIQSKGIPFGKQSIVSLNASRDVPEMFLRY